MSGALTQAVIDAMHAAHAAGSTAEDKQTAAGLARAALDADARARAEANLAYTNGVLTGAAAIAVEAAAQAALGNLATLTGNVLASIRAGAEPAAAVAAAASIDLGFATVDLVAALTTTLAQFDVNGGATAEAAIPLLGGLVRLGARAASEGLAWDAGVEFPFLSDATFAGSVTGDRTSVRRAELAAGYAARVQAGE